MTQHNTKNKTTINKIVDLKHDLAAVKISWAKTISGQSFIKFIVNHIRAKNERQTIGKNNKRVEGPA